jgi:hypothetical protein
VQPTHHTPHTHRRRRRRSRRRARATLWIAIAITAVVAVIGTVTVVSLRRTSTGTSASLTTTTTSTVPTANPKLVAPVAPGVTARSVRVVFPIVAPESPAGRLLAAHDPEYGAQAAAIGAFVSAINASGGVNGRQIDAQIVPYDPTDAAAKRLLCASWTSGPAAAFAVVEGAGQWTGTDQLCIARNGHTPTIAQAAGNPSATAAASPYLWWTGVDRSVMLRALIEWASALQSLSGERVGVVTTPQADDREVLRTTVLPELQRSGFPPPVVLTLGDPNTVVRRLRHAGVGTVLPLMSPEQLRAYLGAATSQSYFPTLLLSDYKGQLSDALDLLASFPRALNDQRGITTLTLGGVDDDRRPSQGGYNRSTRACARVWRSNPASSSIHGGYLEADGPLAGWCQAIGVFAHAATVAGPNLNRRSFVTAMLKVHRFPGTNTPLLTFGREKFSGPTSYRTVVLHEGGALCPLTLAHLPVPRCVTPQGAWTDLTAFDALGS